MSEDHLYYRTRSMCPTCGELVPGEVVGRGGRVLVSRRCVAHGPFEGLICSDRAWYDRLPRFDVQGVRPTQPGALIERGCPEDCGLCPDHLQIAGTAAIEISNECDAACPVCLADNQGTFRLSVSDVRQALDRLLASQERVDSFTLSGGEPTMHPELFEMLQVLQRPEVGRIVINTNGVRIANDPAFVDRLAAHDVFVSLHYDGPRARTLRGADHRLQARALRRLCERGVRSVPLVLAAQGVNDDHLGEIVLELLAMGPQVPSIILSMMTYAGRRGRGFPGDPMERLTIPGALDAIERSSGGLLKKAHFMPLPMPNPLCAAIGYFLTVEGSLTPLLPLVDPERAIEATANRNFGHPDAAFERLLRDTIDRIYSSPEAFEQPEALLGRFRALLIRLFPPDPLEPAERERRAQEHIKTVYLMQFMDAWSFDSERLRKCSCQHLLPNGRTVPSCGYYAYHRRFDRRFDPRFPISPSA